SPSWLCYLSLFQSSKSAAIWVPLHRRRLLWILFRSCSTISNPLALETRHHCFHHCGLIQTLDGTMLFHHSQSRQRTNQKKTLAICLLPKCRDIKTWKCGLKWRCGRG